MGLAASQARFLAITSRKAACEFESMQIASQKLSTTRELDQVTEEYQQALNKTNLVWDVDGSGNYLYNLSYNLMMQPSAINNYTPYLLSRRDGKIALDSGMARAAKAAGIGPDGFSGTDDDKYKAYLKFIGGLQDERKISSSLAKKVIMMEDPAKGSHALKINAGLGGELYGRESLVELSLNNMITYIDMITEAADTGYFPAGSFEYKLGKSLTFDFAPTLVDETTHKTRTLDAGIASKWTKEKYSTSILINGNFNNSSTIKGKNPGSSKEDRYLPNTFTLSDLLNEDVTMMVTNASSMETNRICEILKYITQSGSNQASLDYILNYDVDVWWEYAAAKWQLDEGGSGDKSVYIATGFNILTSSAKTILMYFDGLIKGMYNLLMPEEPTTNDYNAFIVATNDLIDRFRHTDAERNYKDCGGSGNSESNAKAAASIADDYNCWVKKGDNWAISLSNLTETFLTNFVNGMDGYSGDYYIYKEASKSSYITDDPQYIYTINNGEEDVETQIWMSEFYSIIFNTLCSNGWYEEDQINDEEYLNNSIKTGHMFVVSKGSDNNYYQSRYVQANGGHIMENTDHDAIAEAERLYTLKKHKINYKEEQLELKAKQIDAELSALNSEYQSVQTLITNNCQKTFSMFSS